MEPANLHHYQLQFQDELPPLGISPNNSSSSSSTTCYGVETTWTPCTILNSGGGSLSSYSSGAINITNSSSSSDPLFLRQQQQVSMTQDLGLFHWPNNMMSSSQLVKQENSILDSFTQMLKGASASSTTIEETDDDQLSDMNAKLLLGTLSNSGCHDQMINTGLQLYPGDLLYSPNSASRARFSQIYPTINVSSLNNNSSSLDMNLQPLDLVNTTRYGETSFSHNYGLTNHFQHSSESPVDSSTSTISASFSNGVAEVKRTSSMLEPKVPQNAPKKSRIDSRASCPPFKVRKEKLGDRIAALQQLVAPFGKTDTASVLMEAIGYINFLQNQVETLSVPYMKSSRNKTSRSMHGVGREMNGSEEGKRDLRSRGLCLVPLSCMTYVTDGGASVWPPPNFAGGT